MIGDPVDSRGGHIATVWSTVDGAKTEPVVDAHEVQQPVIVDVVAVSKAVTPTTAVDLVVNGLNRLVRPVLALGVVAIFVWSIYDPATFFNVMSGLAVVPDEMWLMLVSVVMLFFFGRIISQDVQKPKIVLEGLRLALEIARQRSGKQPVVGLIPPTGLPPPIIVTPVDILPNVPSPDVAVDVMIADLIVREAGYVNDMLDRGGPTKYGITQTTLAAYRGLKVSPEDVRTLGKVEASKIYRNTFYLAPQIYLLPLGIQAHVFDIGVNSGPPTAMRLLQRALNKLGADLIEDGVFGPATGAATKAYAVALINQSLAGIRLAFYEAVVANHPDQIRFMDGWRKRAALFIV